MLLLKIFLMIDFSFLIVLFLFWEGVVSLIEIENCFFLGMYVCYLEIIVKFFSWFLFIFFWRFWSFLFGFFVDGFFIWIWIVIMVMFVGFGYLIFWSVIVLLLCNVFCIVCIKFFFLLKFLSLWVLLYFVFIMSMILNKFLENRFFVIEKLFIFLFEVWFWSSFLICVLGFFVLIFKKVNMFLGFNLIILVLELIFLVWRVFLIVFVILDFRLM